MTAVRWPLRGARGALDVCGVATTRNYRGAIARATPWDENRPRTAVQLLGSSDTSSHPRLGPGDAGVPPRATIKASRPPRGAGWAPAPAPAPAAVLPCCRAALRAIAAEPLRPPATDRPPMARHRRPQLPGWRDCSVIGDPARREVGLGSFAGAPLAGSLLLGRRYGSRRSVLAV